MSPEPMISRCDAECGPEIIQDRPRSSGYLELGVKCSPESAQRHNQDQTRVDPIHVLVPVTQRDRLLGDMWLSTTWLCFGHGYVER
jgi:hypothetical protein